MDNLTNHLKKIYNENVFDQPNRDLGHYANMEDYDKKRYDTENPEDSDKNPRDGDIITVASPYRKGNIEYLVWDFIEMERKKGWIYAGETAESKRQEHIQRFLN